MPDGRTARIEALFHAALERDPMDRVAFVAEACAGDPLLREEVESYLRLHEEAADFLDGPAWVRLGEAAAGDDAGTAVPEPEPGMPWERLGEFRLIRRLGEGGMGVVYLALQESLGRQVALKVMRPEHTATPEAEARFQREIRTIADLRDPNIVSVFGTGVEHGIRYFAMELVPGAGLDELLGEAASRGERVPLSDALGWIREIAGALDSAHRSGIIHRDVKPSSIRITPEGKAMLMDFGVARHMSLAALTVTGTFQGTPHYASPEQVRAKRDEIDARTDVYSLGVTLYEAATGRVPFEGETTEQVFSQILERDPLPPRRLNRSVSRDLETVTLKAMEKAPDRRYQTMAAFADDLRRLQVGETVLARPAGHVHRAARWVRRRRLLSMAAAALLLLLVAAAIFSIEISRQRREKQAIAVQRFKPVEVALEWPRLDAWSFYGPWDWCLEADVGDPGGQMLKALYHIESGRLEEADLDLGECIARCVARGEDRLAKDSHHLLGIVKLALAQGTGVAPERRMQLRMEAASELQRAGKFDPSSPEAFIWRATGLSGRAGPEAGQAPLQAPPSVHDLRINEEHYLARLFVGLNEFSDMHKGGDITKFEKVIECLSDVLDARPDNVIALTFLGRTY